MSKVVYIENPVIVEPAGIGIIGSQEAEPALLLNAQNSKYQELRHWTICQGPHQADREIMIGSTVAFEGMPVSDKYQTLEENGSSITLHNLLFHGGKVQDTTTLAQYF